MDKEKRFHEVVDTISRLSTADDYSLRYWAGDESLTRFAENMVTQNIDRVKEKLYLTCYFGGKKAMLSTENLTPEGVTRLIQKCESVARESVVDKEYVPTPGHIDQDIRHNVDENVLQMGPDARATMASYAIESAVKSKVVSYGTISNEHAGFGISTKNGALKYYEDTKVEIKNTLDMNGEKAAASQVSRKLEDVGPEVVFEDAMRDLILTGKRQEMDPGRYKVVLSSDAVADLFLMLKWLGMDRRAVDEGYSPYTGKLGLPLGDSRINIYSDPMHPEATCCPFSSEGLPIEKKYLWKEGVLLDVPVSRFWAQKNNFIPWSFNNLIISSNTPQKSDEELIAQMDRGLYVKELWYIRPVRVQDLTLTGMTRNGLFLVENGKIVSGVNHFRWNNSLLSILDQVVDFGAGSFKSEWGMNLFAPSLLVDDFYFSSKTKF